MLLEQNNRVSKFINFFLLISLWLDGFCDSQDFVLPSLVFPKKYFAFLGYDFGLG
jgi:hypothetical protein